MKKLYLPILLLSLFPLVSAPGDAYSATKKRTHKVVTKPAPSQDDSAASPSQDQTTDSSSTPADTSSQDSDKTNDDSAANTGDNADTDKSTATNNSIVAASKSKAKPKPKKPVSKPKLNTSKNPTTVANKIKADDSPKITPNSAVTASPDNDPRIEAAKQISANLVTKPKNNIRNRTALVTKSYKMENILMSAGFNRQQEEALSKRIAVETGFNPSDASIGQKVIFTEKIESGKRKLLAIQFPSDRYNVVVFKDRMGVVEIRKEAKQDTTGIARAKAFYKTGTITTSLSDWGSRAGVPATITAKAQKVLSAKINTNQIKRGDIVELLYEYVYSAAGKQTDLRLLYVNYISKTTHIEGFRYVDTKDTGEFYDINGNSFTKSLLAAPLKGKIKITSGFGYRLHPILGRRLLHTGVDFGAPEGTPIYAAGDGTIDKIGRESGYGNYIRIKHDNVWSTAYAHLKAYAKGMSQWRAVHKGDLIGYVGTTGRSTGAHLHFELIENGTQIDPLKAKLPTGKKLIAKDLYNLKQQALRMKDIIAKLKKAQ